MSQAIFNQLGGMYGARQTAENEYARALASGDEQKLFEANMALQRAMAFIAQGTETALGVMAHKLGLMKKPQDKLARYTE